MKITPKGELYILKNVPLDSGYQHTIDFENEEAQNQYFVDKIFDVFNIDDKTKGYKFIRDNQTINIYSKIEDLFGCNYLMFKNDKKWFYAFITRKDYVSPDVTRLTIKLDVMQSFMFDYEIGESFIVREHQDRWKGTTNLLPIFNKQPEDLEIGKNYNSKQVEKFADKKYYGDFTCQWVLVKASSPLSNVKLQSITNEYTITEDTNPTTMVDDIPSGIYIYLFPINKNKNLDLHSSYGVPFHRYGSEHLLRHLSTDPNIISMQILSQCPIQMGFDDNGEITHPNSFTIGVEIKDVKVYSGDSTFFTTSDFTIARLVYTKSNSLNFDIDIIEELSKNDLSINNSPNIKFETKLYTNPFSKILIEFNNQSQEFNIEDRYSNNNKFSFVVRQSIFNSNNLLVLPKYYLGQEENSNHKFEVLHQNEFYLSNDYWKQYEVNNKVSMNGNLILAGVQSAVNIGLGVATGGVGLAVAGSQALNFGGQVASELIKREDIKSQPNTPKVAGQDLLSSNYTNKFGLVVRVLQVADEFLKIAFNYFTHYGYACRCFKKPNTKSRYYYNYIKTIGANIQSNIDNEYIEELKSIYDNGITFWHYRDANTFKGVQNFDYENVEISLI